MRLEYVFRPIGQSEVETAHRVYCDVVDWLNAKGVRQWLRALPLEVFQEREREKELFGYFVGGRPGAVVSLACETSPYWPELGGEKRWWIKTLAVDRQYRGAGIGAAIMCACEQLVWDDGATDVFLDCVDIGFLPNYYMARGYSVLHRKSITYPSGNSFNVALMAKKEPNQSSEPRRHL
jgi:GNAT superfamily N-acetyltransferase